MTILVDEARWPWRGTKWCHLVSDDNLSELHAFAGGLGQRRVGFQGDHYDIDIDTRVIAIANGAKTVQSREIVSGLKQAGLRCRPSTFAKWQLVQRSDSGGADPSELLGDSELAPFLELADGWFFLERPRSDGSLARAKVVFGSTLPSTTSLPVEDPAAGLFSRIDHDGKFSIERIWPPPTDRE